MTFIRVLNCNQTNISNFNLIIRTIQIFDMKKYLLLAVFPLLLFSCGSDPLDIDASGVDMKLDYVNLDSLLYNSNEKLVALGQVDDKYSRIVEYQLYYCFNFTSDPALGPDQILNNFYNEKYVQRLEKRIHEKFPNPAKNHAEILEGFRKLKFHFPKAKFPEGIVYTNSYFSSSAFCTENAICMGMERYLGAKTDVIKELPNDNFYSYIKEAMNPIYFERDAVCAWVLTHIAEEKEDAYLIEAMVNWGKILYLTEAAFPDKAPEIILRQSTKNYNWNLNNERAFWDYLVKNKLLYSKEEKVKQNMLHEAPFTSGLPDGEKTPDRLGQFIGWRIIHSYMEQYDVTLEELLKTPYTKLIQEYEINE